MTITAQRLLTELGKRSWSGFLPEDMVFGSDSSDIAKTELNVALRYLINLEDFPFKEREDRIFTVRNIPNYILPDGQINGIYDLLTNEQLEFLSAYEGLDRTLDGKPMGFWFEFDDTERFVRFYPSPDGRYAYRIIYNQYKPILTSDGEQKFEIENSTDKLNLPENLEFLFMDCLVLRTMVNQNKNQNDENYLPLINEFNQAWKVFTKSARPLKVENRVVW